MDIIFVNVSPEQTELVLDSRYVDSIKEQIRSCHPEFDINKRDISIHLAGLKLGSALSYECHTIPFGFHQEDPRQKDPLKNK